MGFLGNLFSDLSEVGSEKSKFKKKFTELSKLLSDYSFSMLPCSFELGKQKIIVAYNELIEYGQQINKNEKIKIYFPDRDVDITITTALNIADIWTNSILEENIQFTNSYAIRIIERIKNEEILNKSSIHESKKLKEEFPNLYSFFNEMSMSLKDMYLVIDFEKQFEFKFPFITFGRTMGYNHLGLKKLDNFEFELYYYAVSENKRNRIDATSVIINKDYLKEVYENNFNNMMAEVFANPLLQKIVTF